MTPEAAARQKIDELLVAAGWTLQNYKAFNPGAGRGVALREVPLTSGRCDYLLLVDRVPLGVIEAKKEGTTLSTVSDQSAHYGESLPDFLAALLPGTKKIPFAYESTGVETLFRDVRDPHPRSRRVFAVHQPATLAAWLAEPGTLRGRLAALPTAHPLPATNLRGCQIDAISKLDPVGHRRGQIRHRAQRRNWKRSGTSTSTAPAAQGNRASANSSRRS